MGWLASFATAAFVWTAGADVQTFTVEQRNSKSAVAIKTVFVNEPGLLTVDVSPTLFGYASAIAICPAGCNASQVFACNQHDEPTVAKTNGTVNAEHFSVSEIISNVSVSSHKLVVTEIGGYDVIFASCAGTHQKLTVTISGRTLDAHESGWEVHYAAIAVLYAVFCLAWSRIKGNLETTQGSPTLLSDVSASSVMLLGMACAGFVLHALRPGEEMRKFFEWIFCMTVPTLMTTLLKMTAVGFVTFTDTNWCFEIVWCVFTFLHFIALSVHATYDNSSMFCLRLVGTTCIARPGNTNFILIPLMGNCFIFGVSCCYCLTRSATVLGKTAMGFVSRVAAMVAVYTALSMLSAFCRAYDAPSANPETWKSHFVSDIIRQLTQAFGLATALYVFQQGIPSVDSVIHRVDRKAYEQVDEESQEGDSDDEQNPCIVPVVYGAE